MSSQQGKKHKTGIPVVKILTNSNDQGDEATFIRSYPQISHQGRRTLQQSSLEGKAASKISGIKKIQCPETWINEVIESQSQKMRSSVQSEHKRRREDMERHLKEAEAQLATMASLLEQREKMIKEAAEESEKKTADLEQKLVSKDGLLIKHGIDPVTGEEIILDEKNEKNVEITKKFTKKRVQEIREKLRQMNNETESYLTEVENTLKYLSSLESVSEKAGLSGRDAWMQFVESGSVDDMAKLYSESHRQLVPLGATHVERFAPTRKEFQNKNLDTDPSEDKDENDELPVTTESNMIPDENSDSANTVEDKVL